MTGHQLAVAATYALQLVGLVGLVVGLVLLVLCAGDDSRPDTRGTTVRQGRRRA